MQRPWTTRALLIVLAATLASVVAASRSESQGADKVTLQLKRTADIAHRFGVIKTAADSTAYTHEIWEMARK
jgi:hypothetical protein